MSKWTEERTQQLHNLAGSTDEEVSRDAVAEIAEEMEASARSISSKLRKEGFTVEKAGATPNAFSEEETESIRSTLEQNKGELTCAELAEQLGTDHSVRALQGKILSMEMTGFLKPTPPKEVKKVYSEDETARIVEMVNGGKYLEEIAEALNKEVNSIRGKSLSLLRAGEIEELPEQRDRKASQADAFDGLTVKDMTVEQLAEATGKGQRGIKTMLTRRRLTAQDYDGAARAEKNDASNS